MPTIINDPVHGFIEIADGLPSHLVKHPFLFRLSRIKQLGPTDYVYPGGRHTRLEHSIGAYHLACQAINTLRNKGTDISEDDAEGVETAMMLHDLGHGPFSHVLEGTLVHDVSHEDITLMLMERINKETQGDLDNAVNIFTNQHPRRFLSELIHSQLDLDRMDYLCRDSFFTGVREGNIGAARIIKMLEEHNEQLAVNWKGIYTIENYLMARRLMYWQVYLHKTVIAAKEGITAVIQRARQLTLEGKKVFTTPALHYFLHHHVDRQFLQEHEDWVSHFTALDDYDLECAIKQWQFDPDPILSTLAKNHVTRNLYKVIELASPLSQSTLEDIRKQVAQFLNIPLQEASYFAIFKEVHQVLYSSNDDHIQVIFKDGTMKDISHISELLGSEMVDKICSRYFLLLQRDERITNLHI